MTKPHDSIASPAAPAQSAGGPWRYLAMLGVQTIGAVILFWNAVPLYREVLADPASHEAQPEALVWSLSSIALIQVGYWISNRVRPPLPQFTNALLGHVTLFMARMGFVLATSIFGFVFITQKPGFHIPAFRYVVTLVGLFSLYCYTRELERLGTTLLGQEKKPNASGR
jgi:hypothetical protein